MLHRNDLKRGLLQLNQLLALRQISVGDVHRNKARFRQALDHSAAVFLRLLFGLSLLGRLLRGFLRLLSRFWLLRLLLGGLAFLLQHLLEIVFGALSLFAPNLGNLTLGGHDLHHRHHPALDLICHCVSSFLVKYLFPNGVSADLDCAKSSRQSENLLFPFWGCYAPAPAAAALARLTNSSIMASSLFWTALL